MVGLYFALSESEGPKLYRGGQMLCVVFTPTGSDTLIACLGGYDLCPLPYINVCTCMEVIARAPFGNSRRPSDLLRAKYSRPIDYHAYISYFDWLP